MKLLDYDYFEKSISSNEISVETNEISGTNVIGNASLIKIGNSVSFGGNVLLYANAEISIGDYSMIAINTTFHTSTHDYDCHPMWEYRIDKPIKVGRHVWIGTGSIILPGVIIEDFAVIAAGSLVAANVPKGAIVGGNPARVIKYRSEEIYNREMSLVDSSKAIIKEGNHLKQYCKLK